MRAHTKKRFEVSLNGKDALSGDDTPLQQLGLVSGDLIRIICDDAAPAASSAGTVSAAAIDRQSGTSGTQQLTSKQNSLTQQQPTGSQNAYDNRERDGNKMEMDEKPSASHAVQDDENAYDPDAVQDSQARVYLYEPMLVRESSTGTVPQSLALLYSAACATSQHEALCVVMHALMLETGFHVSSGAFIMPDGWRKAGGVFKIQYTVPNASDASVTLTYVTLGSVANVFCTAAGSDIKHQSRFDPADYVTTLSEKACDSFKNLSRLSTLFKDKVSYPVLQSVRSEAPVPNLCNLPWEVQLQVLKQLKSRDLLHLAAVSRHFSTISREGLLWRRLYMRDFGRRETNNDLSQDWYKLYKEKYILRSEMHENLRHMRSEMIPPPFRDPYADPYPLHPGSNYPPGFVGGDYDRDPAFGGLPDVFGRGGGRPMPMMPRPRFDPIGPRPGGRDPLRPPLPGWGPRLPGNHRRDPGFGGGFGGFM